MTFCSEFMHLNNKTTNCLAVFLLAICFLLAFLSMREASLTLDESPHITAGYSYLTQQDYRLNPEHPPLAKSLAAFPLLFLDLSFPQYSQYWKQSGYFHQWHLGNEFIFNSGNDADQIIFWPRFTMLFLLVFCGWFIFFWTRQLGGNKPALLALTLFSFSPTFLAHGRLVNTDIAAVLGFLIGLYFWVKFLQKQTIKNFILAGLAVGIALCLKFSIVLLFPIFILVAAVYVFAFHKRTDNGLKKIFRYLGLVFLVGLSAVILVIWPLYRLHMLNYPAERQAQDIQELFKVQDAGALSLIERTTQNPYLRPLTHYAFGLLMATSWVKTGTPVYFMGTAYPHGVWQYFPTIYILKTPLALNLLFLLVLGLHINAFLKQKQKNIAHLRKWARDNFPQISLIVLFLVYWGVAVTNNLNLGIRHMLPVFPIIYMLIGLSLVAFIKNTSNKRHKNFLRIIAGILLIWYVSSSLSAFPHYLSYYNELAGGQKNGHKYDIASNYDWGQDLKRLASFVEENNIEKIKVDYFGGDDIGYRLENRAEVIDRQSGPQKGWLAVSATWLKTGQAKKAPGYEQSTDHYNWLKEYSPIDRAGYSIFIYYID